MKIWNESRSHLFPRSTMRNGEVWNISCLRVSFSRTIDPHGFYLDAEPPAI
jgi:hypothetical protein